MLLEHAVKKKWGDTHITKKPAKSNKIKDADWQWQRHVWNTFAANILGHFQQVIFVTKHPQILSVNTTYSFLPPLPALSPTGNKQKVIKVTPQPTTCCQYIYLWLLWMPDDAM